MHTSRKLSRIRFHARWKAKYTPVPTDSTVSVPQE
jgi:hypothetical protein